MTPEFLDKFWRYFGAATFALFLITPLAWHWNDFVAAQYAADQEEMTNE